jgi:effector-binding domain-containing protein
MEKVGRAILRFRDGHRYGYIRSWKLVLTAFSFWLFVSGIFWGRNDVMAIEEARFKVLEKDKECELRQYEPQIVAETLVEGNFEEVGNQGFRRLFSYISWNNRKSQFIPMTAPVTQEAKGVEITMTAPVGQERVGERWRITFLMPFQYIMETLPTPLDPNIGLKTIPGRLMATIRYSGTWSKKNFEENETHLRAWIAQHGLKPAGEPVWARYNPPFTPWFLRRNEILIPVERVQF